jgi:hypothetical protein
MRFVITTRLIVSSTDIDSAAETMEAVDGVAYGAFKRVIEPLIDGSFSLTTETTLEPGDDETGLVFPDTPMGKMLSTGVGRETIEKARARLAEGGSASLGLGRAEDPSG